MVRSAENSAGAVKTAIVQPPSGSLSPAKWLPFFAETRFGYVGLGFLCIIVQSTSGAEKAPCFSWQNMSGRGRRLPVFRRADERTTGNATPS
jgi:hypothetical protein